MKKALIYLAIFGGIFYIARKAGATIKSQVEAKKRQIEQQG